MLPDGYADIVIYNGNFEITKGGVTLQKDLNYTVAKFREDILKLTCSGQRLAKDERAEQMLMPPLVLSFYQHLFDHGTLPADTALADNYLGHYFAEIPHTGIACLKEAYATAGKTKQAAAAGVRNRLYRMYPSLLRDFYFLLLCHESRAFSDVYYSVRQDYSYGYDLVVKRHNQKVYVRLMVETMRSRHYNNRKYTRHDLTCKNIYELKIRLVPERKLGQFYLYNQDDLKGLIHYIDANAC